LNLIFLIKSSSVNLKNYTIKDIPGSSGRMDVISRCLLAALMNDNSIEKNVQIWIFLNNYGTFIFDSNLLKDDIFPKNELLVSDGLVKLIQDKDSEIEKENYLLRFVKKSKISLFQALNNLRTEGYKVYILKETGENFLEFIKKVNYNDNLVFIVGNQSGEFLDSKDLLTLEIPVLSLGTRSYLASSVIRLIKIFLRLS